MGSLGSDQRFAKAFQAKLTFVTNVGKSDVALTRLEIDDVDIVGDSKLSLDRFKMQSCCSFEFCLLFRSQTT